MRLLFKFQKTGSAAFISHLDLLRCVQRTISRAELPIEFTKGFNPHQKISFAQALGIGIQSIGEYLEAQFCEEIDPVCAMQEFNRSAPEGIKITDSRVMSADEPSIMSRVSAAEYIISFPEDYAQETDSALKAILSAAEYEYEKKTKSGIRKTNMRPMILSAYTDNGQITAVLSAGVSNLDPRIFADEINKTAGLKLPEPEIMRTELYYKNREGELSPLIQI